MAKPRSWRRYWWYRPPSLAWARSPKEVQQMDAAYITWLSERRGWSTEQAIAYVGAETPLPASTVAAAMLFADAA